MNALRRVVLLGDSVFADQGGGAKLVRAHAATSPKVPRIMNYRGDGPFMVSPER